MRLTVSHRETTIRKQFSHGLRRRVGLADGEVPVGKASKDSTVRDLARHIAIGCGTS